MVCWSLSAIIGCDTIQQPLVQVKPESMVSLVNINRILYMHVIKKKLDDIDSGKPIIKFVLNSHIVVHALKRPIAICSLSWLSLVCTGTIIGDFKSTFCQIVWRVLALAHLYPDEHWRFQEHLSKRWVESNETGQSKYVTRVFCQSFIVSSLYWLFDHFLPCLANS